MKHIDKTIAAPPAPEQIVHDEGAQLDFSKDMSYSDYLHLDEVLNAQLSLIHISEPTRPY